MSPPQSLPWPRWVPSRDPQGDVGTGTHRVARSRGAPTRGMTGSLRRGSWVVSRGLVPAEAPDVRDARCYASSLADLGGAQGRDRGRRAPPSGGLPGLPSAVAPGPPIELPPQMDPPGDALIGVVGVRPPPPLLDIDPRGAENVPFSTPLRCKVQGGWGGSAHYPDPTAQSGDDCGPRPPPAPRPGRTPREAPRRGGVGCGG